jgi:hypothetical protein
MSCLDIEDRQEECRRVGIEKAHKAGILNRISGQYRACAHKNVLSPLPGLFRAADPVPGVRRTSL